MRPASAAVVIVTWSLAVGRRLAGRAWMVSSAARSWYSRVPALIAIQRLPALAATAWGRPSRVVRPVSVPVRYALGLVIRIWAWA